MSTDKELLELAAKAAGIKKGAPFGGREYFIRTGCEFQEWTPLDDDGDALRLAAHLGITIERDKFDGEYYAQAVPPGTHQGFDEPHGTDPYAATRRAIVRAAAEIGKAMP